MSLVTKQRWEFWMGAMPMPEDCTSDVLWAMHDAVKKVEDKQYAAEQIKWYEDLWRINLPKYTANPQNETLANIMKLIKQGIEFWRKELTE